jgi:hypothetical protein
MARKTAIKRLAKRLPQAASAAIRDLLAADERADQMAEEQGNGHRVDVSRPRRAALEAIARASGHELMAGETETAAEDVSQATEGAEQEAQTAAATLFEDEPPLPEPNI